MEESKEPFSERLIKSLSTKQIEEAISTTISGLLKIQYKTEIIRLNFHPENETMTWLSDATEILLIIKKE